MAASHVVSGLVSKRAEVAGQIAVHKTEMARLQDALSHIDGSIKLFAPDFDLRSVKSKRTNKRNQYFAKGEAQRMVLDAMRKAKTPLCSRELTDALMQRKNIEGTPALVARIQKNIIAVLHRLESKHLVKPLKHDGARGVMTWEIA